LTYIQALDERERERERASEIFYVLGIDVNVLYYYIKYILYH